MPNGFGGIASTIPYLRLQNIFGGGNVDPQVSDVPELSGPIFTNPNNAWEVTDKLTGSGGNEFEEPFDFGKRMNELYTPETAATDRFNKLIASQPQYEKPGFWRTVAAGLSAFGPGGHQTGQAVLNEPYRRKMAQWEADVKPAYQAANLERYANANERALAQQTATGELNARKAAQTARKNEQQTQIQAFRSAISAIKNLGGEWKIIKPKDGNIWRYNNKTGEFIDTQIPVTELGPKEAMEMKLNNRLEEIDALGSNAEHLATIKSMLDQKRQQSNMEFEKGLGSDRFTPNANTGSGGKPLSPTQQARDIWNKVGSLTAQFPALKQYVHQTGSTGYELNPNTPPEIRKMILEHLGVTEGNTPVPETFRTMPPKKGLLDIIKGIPSSNAYTQAGGALSEIATSATQATKDYLGTGKPEEPVPPPEPEPDMFAPTNPQSTTKVQAGPVSWTVNPKTKKVAVKRKTDGKTGWVNREELKSGMYEPFTPPQGSF